MSPHGKKKMSEKDIYEIQFEVIKRLESFVSNFGKTPKERLNLGYLNSRANGLKEIWIEFIENHINILFKIPVEDQNTQQYFTDNYFEKYEGIYYDVLGKISQKQIDLAPIVSVTASSNQPTTSALANNSTPAFTSSTINITRDESNQNNNLPEPQNNPTLNAHHIQIPRLNVPTFSGSYDDWPSFRDLFRAAVHANQSLQPVHKLQYLKSLLKGNAETILKYVPTTSDNYVIAWQRLEERFENKRALITNTLRKLFGQPHAEETAASIRQLLDTSNECINALQSQGIAVATWDSILIYIISQRIPSTSLNL